MCNVTLRHVRANIFAMENAINITYSECVFVDLIIEHAMRMGHIVSCGLPDLKYLYTLSHTRHDFRGKKKVTEHKLCVLISSTNFA